MKRTTMCLTAALLGSGWLLPAGAQEAPAKMVKTAPLPKPALRMSAEPLPPPEEIARGVAAFFDLLKQDKIAEGFDLILKDTRINNRKAEVAELKDKTAFVLKEYGKVMDYELIDSKPVGNRMLVLTYLSYSDTYPIRWKMIYYKPADRWRLIKIQAETEIQDLLE